MVFYEAFIKTVSGSSDEAGPLSLVFCGGMAGEQRPLARGSGTN